MSWVRILSWAVIVACVVLIVLISYFRWELHRGTWRDSYDLLILVMIIFKSMLTLRQNTERQKKAAGVKAALER